MSVRFRSVTVDCTDAERLANFWARALGWSVTTVADEGAVVEPAEPGVPRMVFLVVPEGKTVKNRVHVDLEATESMAEEVARLTELGATAVRRVDEPGNVFTVMTDIEGNEFCVEER